MTILLRQDTTLVRSHAFEIWRHRDSGGLFWNDFLHSFVWNLIFFYSSQVVVAISVGWRLQAGVLAGCVTSVIVFPGNNTVLSCELVCIKHPAALASPINIVAVHQVLHRVDWNLFEVVLDCVQGLKSSCSSKRPAGTAPGLVNWFWDLASLVPVYIIREIRLAHSMGVCLLYLQSGWFFKGILVVFHSMLIKSQVSELVYSLLVSDIKCFVMLFNFSVVFWEDLKAIFHIRLGSIRFAISCKERHKNHSYIVRFLKMSASRNFNDYAQSAGIYTLKHFGIDSFW